MAETTNITNIAHRAKVIPPKLPSRILPRPELQVAMDDALQQRVTLILAAGGYGKTTMLLQTLENLKRSQAPPLIAWLQLDEFDLEKNAFFSALISAVEYVIPGFFKTWRAQLPTMSTNDFIRYFTGELASETRQVILVVEDAHYLLREGAGEAFASFSPLIEQLPPAMRIVITSRRALHLECIPRLRSRQQLSVIDKEYLTLSVHDVETMLVHIYHEEVDAKIVARIAAQVDGWMTGLILLIQARKVMEVHHWETMVKNLSAAQHEFFYAWFMTEVFENLSINLRQCLVLAAEVPEFNPMGIRAALGEEQTKEFFNYIKDENAMFIVVVDDARTRFRFHNMFRTFLEGHMQVSPSAYTKLAAFEANEGRLRLAAQLYRKNKHWMEMLETLYKAFFITKNEIITPVELRDMLDAVPAGLRARLHVWWTLHSAQLIFIGRPAQVLQLPARYELFREPYRSRYLTNLIIAMKSANQHVQIVDTIGPLLNKYLKQTDKIYTQETISLAVVYCSTLAELSLISQAKLWVDWIERRKVVDPDYKEDDMTFIALRSYYIGIKNKDNTLYYSHKLVEYCKEFNPGQYAMSLLYQGIALHIFEMFEDAEKVLVECEKSAKNSGWIYTQLLAIMQLAQTKASMGNTQQCLLLLNSISLDDKRNSEMVLSEVIALQLTVNLMENKPANEQLLRNAKDVFEETREEMIFFLLAQIYRRDQTGKPNAFVERYGAEIIEKGESQFVRALARVAVESERMRMRPKFYADWESAANILLGLDGIENYQPETGHAFYLLEIVENLPAHAQQVFEILEYEAYVVAQYLKMHWARIDGEVKSTMLQWLTGRMERPHIARAVKDLLDNLQIDSSILEGTNVIEHASVSPHLNEKEVGEILVKYGSFAEAAENSLKQFSEREPPPLTIRMFGKFEIEKGGIPVAFPPEVTQPMLTLLKYLISRMNVPVTIDELGATIWKDVSEKQMKNSIYTAISQLRLALEPYLPSPKNSHFILSAERGYKFAFRPIDSVDTMRFAELCADAEYYSDERAIKALRQAVEIYRGQYLQENVFDGWTEQERDRLMMLYVGALEKIVALGKKLKDWGDVNTYAGKGFEFDPSNESFATALIECAMQRNDGPAVRSIYENHKSAIREFYSAEPSPTIHNLYRECLVRTPM